MGSTARRERRHPLPSPAVHSREAAFADLENEAAIQEHWALLSAAAGAALRRGPAIPPSLPALTCAWMGAAVAELTRGRRWSRAADPRPLLGVGIGLSSGWGVAVCATAVVIAHRLGSVVDVVGADQIVVMDAWRQMCSITMTAVVSGWRAVKMCGASPG